ncbi:MAG: hypothetical protein AMXMBFR34_18770 [Myxococcaceae bacterium]
MTDFTVAEGIADAVLSEGARASARRWQSGVLMPRAACGDDEAAHSWQQSEFLVEGRDFTLHARVRFLQVQRRTSFGQPSSDEGVEQAVDLTLTAQPGERVVPFSVPGGQESDGASVCVRQALLGDVFLRVQPVGEYTRVRLRVDNVTPVDAVGATRQQLLPRALVGVHALFCATDGAFVSLLEPPAAARALAASCQNVRAWPVLAGPPGDASVLLASPIPLGDYPQGMLSDVFEGTGAAGLPRARAEEEASSTSATVRDLRPVPTPRFEVWEGGRAPAPVVELRGVTSRAPPRVSPEPTELFDSKGLEDTQPNELPGADVWADDLDLRGMWNADTQPALTAVRSRDDAAGPPTDAVEVHGVAVQRGSHVRLHPGRRRAQEQRYEGRGATVRAVLHDVDGHPHLAVTLDEDAASLDGRFLSFDADEVEPRPERTRVLVAGVGNVALGDDGFGVAVARRLADEGGFPEEVEVADFGLRGVHLAWQSLGRYELLVLVDAVDRGESPGTVFVLKPTLEESGGLGGAHGLDPATVLGLVKAMGGAAGRVLVVGCQPGPLAETKVLSAPVARAVEDASYVVRDVVVRHLADAWEHAAQPA